MEQAKKKMGWGKKILIGIGVFILIGIIGSQLDKDKLEKQNTSTAPKSNEPQSQSASQAAEKSDIQTTAKTDYKIGDEVKFDNYIIKVNSIEVGKTYFGESWKPKEGKKFVAVDVLISNNSQESVHYNTLSDFKVTDENGYESSMTTFGSKTPALSAGDIDQGRKIRGWITFQVEKSSNQFELIYEPGFFGKKKIYIKLQN